MKKSQSLRALYNLVKKHGETGIIVDLPRRRKQRKVTKEMMEFIEQEMRRNDEVTSTGIKALAFGKMARFTSFNFHN